MKFLITFAIFAIVLTAVYGAADPWNAYKTKHGKKYSGTHDVKRKQIFLGADAQITKHNSQKNMLFKLAHNHFSDRTPDESKKYLGLVKPTIATRSMEPTITIDMKDRALPASLDYRNSSCLPPIKNQGNCGSCWAFAAITPIEFAKCKISGAPVVLSEQEFVDCFKYDPGCNGGNYTFAWKYVKNLAGGSAKQSVYPKTASGNTSKFNSSISTAKITPYDSLPSENAANMQAVLQTYGPISVAITAVNSFYYYSSGVYNDVACDNLGVNHGVVVVGYGTLNGVDYWTVRNSWGSDWGDMGYILIQRGVNKCKIETYPAAIASVF